MNARYRGAFDELKTDAAGGRTVLSALLLGSLLLRRP
jgi:hypothetical protein